MAERVILHVGAPKAGTTFLQTLLWNNRDRLGAAGVLVPGRRRFDLNLLAKAVRDGPQHDSVARPPQRVLDRVIGSVRDWPGTVVISNEWLSLAGRADAERLLHSLEPAQLHVVVTARAFVQQVPAAWQETLKLGRASSLPDFVRSLDKDGERWSWSSLDPASVLARWANFLPPEQVHVVTVPPSGADPLLLWRRFASVCGLDPDGYDTTVARSNASLRVEGARLMQLLGLELRTAVDADEGHRSESHRWIRNYLGNRLLADAGSGRIGLGCDELAQVRQRTDLSAYELRTAGYAVVGDLAEFTDPSQSAGARSPDEVSAEELLAVTTPLVAALLARVRAETLRAEKAEANARKLSERKEPRQKKQPE